LHFTLIHVKVHEPYSLSKDALREEGCPWLIKSTRQGSLNNVRHFNTLPHMWHLWPNTCSTTGGKTPSLSKEPAWYHVKVHEPYSLSKDSLREEAYPWLIKSTRQWSLINVGHFNTPPHVWQLWSNTCSTTGGKCPSLSKHPSSLKASFESE
jgi:hypothetical protein